MSLTPYYDSGGITLYHADCRDVLPTIDPASVALVLTDPPYGIRLMTGTKKHRDRRSSSRDWSRIVGDNEPFDPSPLLRFPRVILFGANNYADKLPPSKGWLVWDKRPGLAPNDNGDCELAWTNVTGACRRYAHAWDGVIRDSENGEGVLHPAQKPVALMVWILSRWSKPGDLILDPYAGSGPIAKACQLLGRRYIGCEIVEQYVKATIDRLAQQVLPLDIPA